MPSTAYKTFNNYNLKDIERLLDNHETVKGTGKGKRALDHITRSTILLLVASWELYIEEVVIESVEILIEKLDNPINLPNAVKKSISNYVKNDKNELAAFKLAGEGWKNIYRELIVAETDRLNTPKKDPINILFNRYLGLVNVSQYWKTNSLNTIVTHRGQIAHRVKSINYVTVNEVELYIEEIKQHVIETDKILCSYLKRITTHTPWYITYPSIDAPIL
ncbi:HEPN domain-containing protein [Viridibacillus sp. FSL H8-0110]|uniref:HEPN domain-containing protein n=1 Tax=Viridibacillus sp. FSL H8-0110 TaxID=2921376 RepID=UPI0030FA257D